MYKRILPKQKPNIPAIEPCALCGSSNAKLIDWDFRDRWAVSCYNCANSIPECNTQHRAVSRWNKKQLLILSESSKVLDLPV